LNWKNASTHDHWRKGCDNFRDQAGFTNLSYGTAYTPYVIADTRPNLNYQDLRGKLKEGSKTGPTLELAALDPGAEESVNCLDLAIDDISNLLRAVEETKGLLTKSAEGDNFKTRLSLSDVIISFNTRDTEAEYAASIKNTGLILGDLFTSLVEGRILAPRALAKALADLGKAVDKLSSAIDDNYGPVQKEEVTEGFDKINAALASAAEAEKDLVMRKKLESAQEATKELSRVIGQLPESKDFTPEAAKVHIRSVGAAFKALKQAVESAYGSITPLTADLSRHLMDLLKQLQPKLADLASDRKPVDSDALKTLPGLIAKISASSLQPLAALIDTLLCGDLHKSVIDNVSRLSDGLYSASAVYRSIFDAVQKALKIQPPSTAVAGHYADSGRRCEELWKAPANFSLSSCLGLTQTITAEERKSLMNVDSVAGKSINAIRAFPGEGYLVRGARTLDGNRQEWRYFQDRRFINMVDSSARLAIRPFVFEPNNASIWAIIKDMLVNFLTPLWKEGALKGDSPVEAFFVNVGLGDTMTKQDILDGRLIIDIGLAVYRPAEFIMLNIVQKMQQA
jgi:hypothetical protein